MKFRFINRFIRLYILILIMCSIAVHSSNRNYDKRGVLQPVIGRLFKADVPSLDSSLDNSEYELNDIENFQTTNQKNSVKHLPKSFSGSTNRWSNSGKQIFDKGYTEHIEDRISAKRVRRSKGIILSGIKHETDYAENKVKKHDYEFRKKSIVRNNVKQKRVKRSENLPPTMESESVKQQNLSSISQSKSNYSGISDNILKQSTLSKKAYTQKLFQRKVEALFNIDADKSSGLSQDEIEKSKLLRKQLLSFYVKGKQKKTNVLASENDPEPSKQENGSTHQRKDGKSVFPYFRMNVDVPIKDTDIEEFGEGDPKNGKEDLLSEAEGRSRRRRLRRIAIPLLLALKLKMAIVLPILFGLVSLIAFKGLWAGMTALGVVSMLGLKSLINSHGKVVYEVRSPHRYPYPPPMGIHEIQYHHGGYPEYWNRREDSYKPIGGWSTIIGRSDLVNDSWNSSSEFADQFQEKHTNLTKEKLTTDCDKNE